MNDDSNANASPLQRPSLDELGGWRSVFAAVADQTGLSEELAGSAMVEMLEGRATDAQVAALLRGLRVQGERVAEVVGFASEMRRAAVPLHLPDGAIDIVGTGGSPSRRQHALNVSTMAAFVAASAGATVCKHGNYKVSSTSGSFDFLTQLGIPVDLQPTQLEAMVDELGVGFALAQRYHPAVRHVGPVRAQLGVRTAFNILGPLAHPARVRRQLVGAPTEALARLLAEAFVRLGSEYAWVVSGAGGLDEIATSGPSVVFHVTPQGIERVELDVRAFGIHPPETADGIAGGNATENVRIFEAIVSGDEVGPRHDLVVLNAGAALVVAGVHDDLEAGIQAARSAVLDGRTARMLGRARAWTAPEGK